MSSEIFYTFQRNFKLKRMKRFFALFITNFMILNFYAQTIEKTLTSSVFELERDLKIQLPRNYNPEADNLYPLVLVLDGDYLFDPVAGNIDYQSYWEDIPDCIIVGITQENTRISDFSDTELFYDFITKDVLPYIETTYKVSGFRIIVGHELSANYANNYLLELDNLFRAYVILSPSLDKKLTSKLLTQLSKIKKETFYYLATGESDIYSTRVAVKNLNAKLLAVNNPKLLYTFDDFKDANHYSLVGRGIPKALNKIFVLYKPINRKEYKEKILTHSGSPYDYLIKKYKTIAFFYGFKKNMIENDIRAVMSASIKKDNLESIEKLAILVKNEFKDSMLSAYYMGLYNEKKGNLQQSIQIYI